MSTLLPDDDSIACRGGRWMSPGQQRRPDAANIGAANDQAGNLKSGSTIADRYGPGRTPHMCRNCPREHACHCGPSTIDRPRLGYKPAPPMRKCPWCHADPGVACYPRGIGARGERLHLTPSGSHPSRIGAA
jgi:hypothetical protein